MQQSNQIAARRFGCLAIRILGKLGSVPLQQPTTLFSQALDRGCVELFIRVHTLVYVFSRSKVLQTQGASKYRGLLIVSSCLLYPGGILKLAGAKLFGGEFMARSCRIARFWLASVEPHPQDYAMLSPPAEMPRPIHHRTQDNTYAPYW